jgi:putative transcriptional regulator
MSVMNIVSNDSMLQEIGIRIRSLRMAANLTQKSLAGKSGVSFGTIQNIESGKSISLSHLINIAVALGRSGDIQTLFEVPEISPVELAKMRGKRRQRVRYSKEQKRG